MTLTLPAIPKCTATNATCIENRARVRKARGDVYTARAAIEYQAATDDVALAKKLRAPPVVVTPPPPPVSATKPATDAEAVRFLVKASLSASETEIAAIKTAGYEPWLNVQIDQPIAQTGVAWLASKGYDQVTIEEYYWQTYPGDYMIWAQLMTDQNSVRKRVALALSEFLVVGIGGFSTTWNAQAIARYWDQLNENAFGNFRKLLEDITLNYAMGRYLSTTGNLKEDTATGRMPDQNYAREIMQLFSIGLYQLNNDGTRKLDANGQPIETYNQSDVANMARVFTGYDPDNSNRTGTKSVRYPDGDLVGPIDPVVKPITADPTKWYWGGSVQHSMLEKKFLGVTIPANTGPEATLKIALDTLFNHPNVGPFFAKLMIQRLVTSNPSPAYVDRVAKVFNNNGSGVRGDLRAVFKAILLDIDAISSTNSPTFGKVREPMLRFIQWGRTFGANSVSGHWKICNLSGLSADLAQSPLRSPSVFNYFRPGYVPSNTEIAANLLVAPEFQIVTEVTTAAYVNFMTDAIANPVGVAGDVRVDYARELAIAHDTTALLDRICLLMSANQIASETKATIKAALDAETDKLRRVHLAILLVMASPDYIVQK